MCASGDSSSASVGWYRNTAWPNLINSRAARANKWTRSLCPHLHNISPGYVRLQSFFLLLWPYLVCAGRVLFLREVCLYRARIRRELRAFSIEVKAEWIRAIINKVRMDADLTLVVLLKHIRNPVLVATAHDPALIPSL